ncbi:MAG: restriction endonuclease subunit S [Actinobacteria bacterium]|nr:restriction endonuclease subunit S [Actinomycetota bacterium]
MLIDNTWPTKKLRDLADIRISNVDKKVQANQKTVKLCNYMDVYSNNYITDRIRFMEGSASKAEIERFGIDCGDVIITKDSETPDDIGIPTVIMEDIDNLVCGYHLALIKPNKDQIDSVYLAKQLSTTYAARYFALHASGSTRYGLPISAIESIKIPIPTKLEQKKIAEILSTVDRAIDQTEALIAKQQRIKTGLMQDLLTRGIDVNGNLRSEQTHKFKDSPLGRIPIDWNVSPAHSLCISVIDCKNRTPPESKEGHPVIRTPNVRAGKFIFEDLVYTDQRSYEVWTARGKPQAGDVVITREAPFGEACIIPEEAGEPCLGQRMMMYRPDPKKIRNDFLLYAIYSEEVQKRLLELAGGSTVGHIRVGDMRNLAIQYPLSLKEQERIAHILNGITNVLGQHTKELTKLRRLKTALMQDLLTGKKSVTPLLNDSEAMSY